MIKKNGKVFRNKDELMAKIENAIRFSNVDDERTSAKMRLIRGLEIAPLSQIMIDFLYKKEDITEEILEYIIKKNGNKFTYDDTDINNVQGIVSDYLEEIEIQMLSDKLHERAEKELNGYVQNLKNEISAAESTITNDSILNIAYKLTIMNEMLIYIKTGGISDENQLQALLTESKPLDYLYDEWLDCDVNIKDNIVDMVDNIAYDLSRQTDYNGIDDAIQEAEGYEL
jgi:hypothetical protein